MSRRHVSQPRFAVGPIPYRQRVDRAIRPPQPTGDGAAVNRECVPQYGSVRRQARAIRTTAGD